MRGEREKSEAETENTNREMKTPTFFWILPTPHKINYRTSFSVKIANQNCSTSCEFIRAIFNCHGCSLQIIGDYSRQQLPCQAAYDHVSRLWHSNTIGYVPPQSQTYFADSEIILFTVLNAGVFCLTNAIFNYTEPSILLWSNGLYYSSKWH